MAKSDAVKEWLKKIDERWEWVEREDAEARKRGDLTGRFIFEPMGDGKAVYRITKVNKRTVRIHVITGLGDDWVIPYWGREASIPRAYAEASVRGQDALHDLFRRGA